MILTPATVAVLAALATPVLAFVGKFAFDRRDPGAYRSLKRHAELYELVPNSAKPALESLLKAEAERYSNRRIRHSTRKIKGSSLATLIVVGVATALITWPIVAWALLFWPAWILASLVALFGAALMLAGSFQLFEYPGEPRSDTSVT